MTLENLEFNPARMIPDWAMGMQCAVTVCDADCRIIYMNARSRDTFAEGSDRLIGHNLMDYHPEHARLIIRRLLAEGSVNAYTIEKNGIRKLIYQTPWTREDGSIGGLVELSIPLPGDMPHYVRG